VFDEALESAERAIRENDLPRAAEVYEAMLAEGSKPLALLLRQLVPLYLATRRPLKALDAANALSYFEPSAEAYSFQSTVLARLGLDPLPAIYRALELAPHDRGIINELLFTLATTLSPSDYLAEAKRWAIPSSPRVTSHRAPSSLPRIGYVTGDAKQHVMDRVIEPLLKYAELETVVYDNTEKQDEKSTYLRSFGQKWKYIRGLKAEAIAQQVRDDGIDVLVDLSGLTAGNRLDVFALRPAPVQVTAFGCLFSTGMDCFDYRFADVEDQAHYSEPLWRLSTGIAPMHLGADLPVSPLPALKNGFVTFGYVNGLRKLSKEFIERAISIIQAVPNSKLLVMTLGASDPETATSILRRFGPIQDRVLLTESVGGLAFCRLFSEIDIAIDPTPYGGCMTTFDTLFHGVPILCHFGKRRVEADAARLQSEMDSFLFCYENVVYAAQRACADLQRLARIRQTLRPSLLRHPAGQPSTWVREIESAYRSMSSARLKEAA